MKRNTTNRRVYHAKKQFNIELKNVVRQQQQQNNN